MSHKEELQRWTEEILCNLTTLSRSQALLVATWSMGMSLIQSCSTSRLAAFWATLLGKSDNTMRQYLREFYQEASKKRGEKRKEIDVTLCFEGLLNWVVGHWHENRLALALDPTTLGDRFVVLVVSVLWGRCAIPVAWRVLPANKPGAWKDEWLKLFELLAPAIPKNMQVIVCADRGLYARWLFEAVVEIGWHPFFRVNKQGTFRCEGEQHSRPLHSFCKVGQGWCGKGTAFKGASSRLACTVLTYWHPRCKDPWIVVTDLEAEKAEISWYRLRSWIEQGFKVVKSGGLNWQKTHLSDPSRADRVWLAMSISLLKMLSLGVTEEEEGVWNPVSVFRRGFVRFFACLLNGERVPPGEFRLESWEEVPVPTWANTLKSQGDALKL